MLSAGLFPCLPALSILSCPCLPSLTPPHTHISQKRPGPSYALHELKGNNKPNPWRIALLNRWQDCRKINTYGPSKHWCIWGASSRLGKAPNEMRQRKSLFQLNTEKCAQIKHWESSEIHNKCALSPTLSTATQINIIPLFSKYTQNWGMAVQELQG